MFWQNRTNPFEGEAWRSPALSEVSCASRVSWKYVYEMYLALRKITPKPSLVVLLAIAYFIWQPYKLANMNRKPSYFCACMSSSANCEVFTHDLLCRIKRKRYHSHREKSRASPDKYMTLIVDGMDQAKTNIPYTKVATESTSSLWRLRTHVSGILIHTKAPCGKLAYVFIDIL